MLRFFDFTFALLGLVFGFPVLLVIYVLGLFDTGSPLFWQERVGRNKKPFNLVKFRTMKLDTASVATHLASSASITRFGHFLRKTKLDELPQLWNVLCGDMSAVGPRPLSLRDYGLMPEDWQRRRFSMKPGLTCIWQVSGRNEVTFDEWMQMDLVYIDTWRLKNDFIIILKTFYEVLRGGGK